jgi:phage terminase large subunit GpA-like protein
MFLPSTYSDSLFEAYNLDPILPHCEWAEENMVFEDRSVSPVPGKLSLANSPHLRLPLQLLDRDNTTQVWCQWASQLGKTLMLYLAMAYKIKNDPAVCILYLPKENMVKQALSTKIMPNLKSMPKVWKTLEQFQNIAHTGRTDKRSNFLPFPGGSLSILGIYSSTNRKSISAPYIFFDECGEMESEAMAESLERQKAYELTGTLAVGVSTIVHDEDGICTYSNNADCILEYQLICPNCEQPFYPSSDNFKYDKEAIGEALRKSAFIECPNCSHAIYDEERRQLLYDGKNTEWIPTKGDIESARTFGLKASTFHSLFTSLGKICEELVACADDPSKLGTFYRGYFNEFYTSEAERPTPATALLNNAVDLNPFEVPDDTVALYLSVDSQKDHFWVLGVAYSPEKRGTLVYAERVETFGDIVTLFEREWYCKDEQPYKQGVRRVIVDSGGYKELDTYFSDEENREKTHLVRDVTLEVKSFVFEMNQVFGSDGEYERFIAGRGYEELPNDEPFRFITTHLKIESWTKSRSMKLMKLNTRVNKLNAMSGLIRVSNMIERDETPPKRNSYFIATHLLDNYGGSKDRYHLIEQLTSEKFALVKGKKKKTWTRVKRNNHFFDCLSQAEAIATMDGIEFIKNAPTRGAVNIDKIVGEISSFII